MAQFARPDADVSTGNWSASSGSALYAMIDESSASDSDDISVTDSDGSAEACTVGLSSVTDPDDTSSHSVVVRAYTDSFYSSVTLNVALKAGSTTIKNQDFTPSTSFSNFTMSLSATEAGNIGSSGYGNLSLVITATDSMMMMSETRVSQAYFTCPEAQVNITPTAAVCELTASIEQGTTIAPAAASVVLAATAAIYTSISVTPTAASFDTDSWLPSFVHGGKTTFRRAISSTNGVQKHFDSSFTETSCEEDTGSRFGVSRGTGDEYLTERVDAWWFNAVNLPRCYNVSSAFITAKVATSPMTSEWYTLEPTVTIRAADADNPSDSNLQTCSGFNTPTRTTASVDWEPTRNTSTGGSEVVYAAQNTSDISSIVNELRNRSGWNSGQNMLFFFEEPTPRPSTAVSWNVNLDNDFLASQTRRSSTFIEITFDGVVGEITKTIGSSTNHGTSTPTSSSGSDPYTVGFDTAVTGVSVGDKVIFEDHSQALMETYTYRVAVINSSTSFDLTFLSGGSQGNVTPYGNLYAEDFSQASGVFKTVYDYESPRAWTADLDDDSLYCDGDDAIGIIMVNEKYDEGIGFANGSSVSLNSVKLTVDTLVRHNGTAGSGAGFKYTGQSSSGGGGSLAQVVDIKDADNVTLEWLEFDGTGAAGTCASHNFVTDHGNFRENNTVRNCLMHGFELETGADSVNMIRMTTSNSILVSGKSHYILNNIIYGNVLSTIAGGSPTGIYANSGRSENPIYVYNNTVHDLTARTEGNIAVGIKVTPYSVVTNNIVTDITGSSTSVCFANVGVTSTASRDYNLSTDDTAFGSNSIHSAILNNIYSNASGTVDLHLKPGSPAVDAGFDLGTTPTNVNIDIDGRDRDAEADTWDIGADEFVLNGVVVQPAAAVVEVSIPDPAVVIASLITPTNAALVADASVGGIVLGSITHSPSVAAIETSCPDPSVDVFHPSITVTPAAAVIVTTATANVGLDITVTPSAATIIVEATFAGIGFTSVTVSPAAAVCIVEAPTPTTTQDSFSFTPDSAVVIVAGITPTTTESSITKIPAVAAIEVASVTPTITLGSIAITPSASSIAVAAITPTLVFGSTTATPSAAAVELNATYVAVAMSSVSVTPSVASVVAVAITPTVTQGSLSLSATAVVEAAAQSPTATNSSVTVTPIDASVLVESKYGGLIAGNVTVIPNPQARINAAAIDPTVAFGSQVVTPGSSEFVANATFAAVVKGNLDLSPAACIVEISAVSPTIDMGLDIAPPVAAAIYDVGSFTLLVGKLSAYVGYSFSGLIDYDVDGLIDYELSEPIDYQTTTSPIDYSNDGLLDYEYDN